MAAGLTKAERIALDMAIVARIGELQRALRNNAENSGLSDVRSRWRDQLAALESARPKVAALRVGR